MAESAFLWVKGLRFAYPECAVLDNLSLAWPPGLALVRGDESTGKTTLLRVLAGALTAQAGSITLQGVTMRRWQAANGQSAAEEHSPVTMPVARRPRSRMSVISDMAQYGLPPGESK